jgi:hypothetical protein
MVDLTKDAYEMKNIFFVGGEEPTIILLIKENREEIKKY